PPSPMALFDLKQLARWHVRWEHPAEAKACIERAAPLRERLRLVSQDLDWFEVLAQALQGLGQPAEAVVQLREMLRLSEQTYGRCSGLTAHAHEALAQGLRLLGSAEGVEEAREHL